MDFNTSYNKIVTDENMMEMIQHGDRGYPFKLYYDDLALFDFHCVEWHWPVGFEFVLIETGAVTFGIGEKQVTLEKGHGVFINSKILHRYYSDGHAVVPNCVVDPDFLAAPESLIYKKYVQPIQKSALNGLIFSPDIAWQAEAISVMRDIVAAQDSEKDVELVEDCKKNNIGFIAMKALSGGLLTSAEAAYAFFQQFDNAVPIWGMQKKEELAQFLDCAQREVTLTPELEAVIAKDREELAGNFCRGCGYCMPCPQGIQLNTICRLPQLLRRL